MDLMGNFEGTFPFEARHYLQEDEPRAIAARIVEFLQRNRT